MSEPSNLFADIPARLPQELFQTLLATPHVRVERIVSQGHHSPAGFWYDQEENEWVLLIQGAARLQLEGREAVDLVAGSFLHIPAHQRHRVEWTAPSPTVWLAVFYH